MISKNKWCEMRTKGQRSAKWWNKATATGHEARPCLLHILAMQSGRVPDLSGLNDHARSGNLSQAIN